MPQSLANVLLHLVFSTKDRCALITDQLRPDLHAYMAGILHDLGCPALIINSVPDHAHVLCALSRTLTISKLVEELKTHSTKWIRTRGPRRFAWQGGYGAFSVSQSNAPTVRKYILNQEAHHRTVTFQDEYRRFLERHHIAYDERYLWD